MKFKTLLIVITIFAFSFLPLKSDEAIKEKLDPHKYNFYTGMFDFIAGYSSMLNGFFK